MSLPEPFLILLRWSCQSLPASLIVDLTPDTILGAEDAGKYRTHSGLSTIHWSYSEIRRSTSVTSPVSLFLKSYCGIISPFQIIFNHYDRSLTHASEEIITSLSRKLLSRRIQYIVILGNGFRSIISITLGIYCLASGIMHELL